MKNSAACYRKQRVNVGVEIDSEDFSCVRLLANLCCPSWVTQRLGTNCKTTMGSPKSNGMHTVGKREGLRIHSSIRLDLSRHSVETSSRRSYETAQVMKQLAW